MFIFLDWLKVSMENLADASETQVLQNEQKYQ